MLRLKLQISKIYLFAFGVVFGQVIELALLIINLAVVIPRINIDYSLIVLG